MDTILVTALGSYAADIVIKNLKKNGYRVIGSDIYPMPWIADAYNVDIFYQVPKAIEEKAYLDAIQEICKRVNVQYIIPLTDVEIDIYSKNRKSFSDCSVCICISSERTINICRHKKKMQEFIDINLPEIRTIPSLYVEENSVPPYEYPMMVKPYDGRSSQGLYIINDYFDWQYFISKENTDKYIVQPYIKGNVVTVDIVSGYKGTPIVAIPRIELLRTPNGAGTSVMVFANNELEEKCKKLAKATNVVGCVNFEFLLDQYGRYSFIECNPRFSGGVEFSCIAGYDCIINHMKCFQQLEIDSFQPPKQIYIARKYEEYVTEVSDD